MIPKNEQNTWVGITKLKFSWQIMFHMGTVIHCFLVQNLGWNFSLEFRMLFCGRRKMEGPGENPSERGQEPPTNSTHK